MGPSANHLIPTRRYYASLDGLRGFAVLAVVVFHLYVPGVLRGGFIGVDVFFVLSGYLITSLLLQEHDEHGNISLKLFYVRRALRLLPALIAVVFASLFTFTVLKPAGDSAPSQTLLAVLGALFYFSCWLAVGGVELGYLGHTWSLAVEEHFYFVWPLVIGAILQLDRRRATRWIFAIFLGAIAHRIFGLTLFEADWNWVIYAPDARAEQILFGCALAGWLHEKKTNNPNVTSVLAFVGAIVLILAALLVTRKGSAQTGISTVLGLATAAVVLHVQTDPRSSWVRVLSWRPLVWLGRRSYGLYLLHVPVFALTAIPVYSKWGVLAKAGGRLVLVLALTALCYRYVEAPFLALKARIGERKSPVPIPVSQ